MTAPFINSQPEWKPAPRRWLPLSLGAGAYWSLQSVIPFVKKLCLGKQTMGSPEGRYALWPAIVRAGKAARK
jgi:hypothetical protein